MPASVFLRPRRRKQNPGKGLIGYEKKLHSYTEMTGSPVRLKVRHSRGLSGAEKRRKRKGGNPKGGPGQKGAERFARDVPRSKKGLLR